MKQLSLFEISANCGTIERFMRNRHIRNISIVNYFKWKGYESPDFPVSSVKFDIYDNTLKLYGNDNKVLGSKDVNKYSDEVFDVVSEISENEKLIPYKKRRNIIVKVNR